MRKEIIILLGIILPLWQSLFATTINIPSEQSTIQAGINVASNGDTVLVQPGTYVENINYNGKNIVVGSLFLTTQDTSYISQTVIDGDSLASVVTFESGEDSTTILCGFIITNGYANYGGGIYCYDSSPSLSNVTITDNYATYGGGILCIYSSPSITIVTISGNSTSYGGGIYCYESSPSFINVTITDNYANNGGGIYCSHSSPSLINCILWNDTPQEIHIFSSSVVATYSAIEGGWGGEGNINTDPLFIDPDNGDYHLSWANCPIPDSTKSPCIDSGDPSSPPDPDGTITDMGAYYFLHGINVDFTADNTEGEVPLTVQFTDLSVSGGLIISWEWDFDYNGTIDSYDQNPEWTYNDPGNYTVSLTVTDENSQTDTETKMYYIYVSYGEPPLNLSVTEQGYATWEPPAVIIYYDDFESYNVGEYLAVQSEDWTTWSNAPGSSEDAYVSDEQALSGTKSVKVEGTRTDLVHEFGNLTTGHYLVTHNYYIVPGYGGYYNLLHNFNGFYSEWGFAAFFAVDGSGYIDAGGMNAATFTYTPAAWTECIVDIDLDNDWATFFVNGVQIYEWQWSLLSHSGAPGMCQLGAINIYASAPPGENAMYYFDDLSLAVSETSNELIGYKIYLDGTYNGFTEDLFWQYSDLTSSTTYLAGVSALYDDGESNIVEESFTYYPLSASFIADVTSGNAPLTVNFTDLSIGDPINWEWDFQNDGIIDSYTQNPEWIYNEPGTYTVSLTISDGIDFTDTETKVNYIDVFDQITIINIPDDYTTIQEGIDFANNGDTVLVQQGTYVENINFNGKNITIASLLLITQDTTYISQTIIDGSNGGSVVTFENEEDSTAILIGFTITNGSGSGPMSNITAGGITCKNNSNPSLEHLIITGNWAYSGGGIFCEYSYPRLKNVIITNNSTFMSGGGIFCSGSTLSLENVTIADNIVTGMGGSGGGIRSTYSNTNFVNCILWNNFPNQIGYISTDSIVVIYSDIEGGWVGEGNIDADPLFVDAINGNYHLTEDSPCIDAGDPDSPLDPDGTVADMGAYYYHQQQTPAYTNIKVFLEGPYNSVGDTMECSLTVPTTSPYNSEFIGSLPTVTGHSLVDWIQVKLRTTATGSTVDSCNAFLLEDGSVVDVQGNTSLPFYNTSGNEYYIVIHHRNHLDIMSAVKHTFGSTQGEATNINLTTSNSIYGDGYQELETGVYGMYSGDINNDGEVTTSDYTSWYNAYITGSSGYQTTDLNMDGEVTTSDYTKWYNNFIIGASSSIPVQGKKSSGSIETYILRKIEEKYK